ncbi:MAG: acyl-CoA synthetase (AMP-forming)/AMP-acid ligase II [Glaciecola sp.]|jgi:acyl-CoA synthetase (AMP-forming)/AMP-acid ligase II
MIDQDAAIGLRVHEVVAHWAGLAPDREALVGGGHRWSHAELSRRIDALASALLAAGVEHGDRVACLGNPRPETLLSFLAAASVGAIWVGLNPKYTSSELLALLERTNPKVAFGMLEANDTGQTVFLAGCEDIAGTITVTREPATSGRSTSLASFCAAPVDRPALDRARDRVAASDAAAMIFTSGTTGVPKGALVPHGGLAHCGRVQADHWCGDAPRVLCDLPINHIGCLGDIFFSTLVAGGTVVCMERFDAEQALAAVEREKLSHLMWVPSQYIAAVGSPAWETADLSSLQRLIWGGATAPMSLLTTLSGLGVPLSTSYGLTESTGSVVFTDDEDPLDRLGWSVGRPDPRYEVTLRRTDGGEAQDGEEGEVLIRGAFITRGYWQDADATSAAIDDHGWLSTGDIGSWVDGRLRLIGRAKETFKSGGYNVYPREVELALEEHPHVELAALVSVPDDRWGRVGHAFVQANGAVVPEELRAFAAERLANFKVPKSIRVQDELPRLPVGKIDKKALSRLAEDSLLDRTASQ